MNHLDSHLPFPPSFLQPLQQTKHPKDFITTGLFRFSRYPSYFGEVVLWLGMYLLCLGGFTESWQWVGTISPVFVFILLYFVSGVRMLEKSSEERYGKREDYQRYKAQTSQFIPWFPRKLPEDWKPALLSDPEQGRQVAVSEGAVPEGAVPAETTRRERVEDEQQQH